MTTTNKRQLRLTINAVLEKHGIDDLALEGEITEVVSAYYDKTSKGTDPAKARGDILSGILHYKSLYQSYEQMSERIEKAISLHPDGSDKWNEVITHCTDKLASGETIEQYATWLSEDKFNSPKSHQIAMNPRLIITTWPQAFKKAPQQDRPEYTRFTARETLQSAKPNPYAKPNALRTTS